MSALVLNEVVRHYPSAGEVVRAVDGVSLTVEPGEFASLYGPSGSGKTTLLLIAAGLLEPDAGTVYFGGQDVALMSSREGALYRRREVGFVFQSFHLIGAATALDNAALKLVADGLSLDEARRAARPWLERVGLAEREHHTPDALSTGERQRVAIARALTGEPSLILADEPTGNLDTKRGREILEMLRSVCRERSLPVLLVTHDPQAAAIVDRVHTLRDGRLVHGRQAEVAAVAGG